MAVKLLMKYDIKPGREQEFFEFQVREWVPGLQKLGLEPTDHWYTMYGNSPQILAGGMTKSLKTMQEILDTEEWQALKGQLLSFVDNYEEKVVKANRSFQIF
jgi:hypothetical protein